MMRPSGKMAARRTGTSIDVVIALSLLCATFLFGGSQRMDASSQLLVRLAAIAVIAVACVRMSRQRWSVVRLPVLLAMMVAVIPALQLVPLPPGLWAVLPGHHGYAEALASAGLADVWRPISLSPDRTLNSLLSLLPPIAGALTFGLVSRDQRGQVIAGMLVLAMLGALLSTVQAATGNGYFYATPNVSPSANFANRNHWAMYLACCFPLLVAWVCAADGTGRQTRWLIAGIAAAAILPLLLIAGSRAGLLLGAAALLMSAIAAWPVLRRTPLLRSGRARAAAVAALVLALAACLVFVLVGRGVALSRLLNSGGDVDLRSANLPAVWQMLLAFFPIGAGFGVFDPLFRTFESDALLRPSYFNHAHCDPLEVVIEAGALGLMLILAVVFIIGRATARVWRTADDSAAMAQARAMVLPALILMVGSLADYPLRTPFLATFFVLCAVWSSQDALILRIQSRLGTSTKVR